jgi:hypothetical protein
MKPSDKEELELYRTITKINETLEALATIRRLYPPPKAIEEERPCALHTAALSS